MVDRHKALRRGQRKLDHFDPGILDRAFIGEL